MIRARDTFCQHDTLKKGSWIRQLLNHFNLWGLDMLMRGTLVGACDHATKPQNRKASSRGQCIEKLWHNSFSSRAAVRSETNPDIPRASGHPDQNCPKVLQQIPRSFHKPPMRLTISTTCCLPGDLKQQKDLWRRFQLKDISQEISTKGFQPSGFREAFSPHGSLPTCIILDAALIPHAVFYVPFPKCLALDAFFENALT